MFSVRKKPRHAGVPRTRKTDASPKMDLPERNPLDLQVKNKELTGRVDEDDKKETTTALNLLKSVDEQAKRVMGNGYWCALVFPDEVTCVKFMELAGWYAHTEEGAYVDGIEVAKMLGIELGKIEPITFKSRRSDKRLVNESRHPQTP